LIGSVLATTSGSTSAIVIGVTVVATLTVVALLVAAASLVRSARRLRVLAAELDERTETALAGVEDTVRQANDHLARVDELVGSAEAISERVGTASRLAQTAVSGPLIKAVAFGAGTARAGRRLKEGR
jgi:hypothetical protein